MPRLKPPEQAAFAEAASAALAQKEMMEVIRKQTGATTIGGPGDRKVPAHQAKQVLASAAQLRRVMLALRKRYPSITAYRFRRHLFVPTMKNGEVVAIQVMPETAIETVEG